MSKLSVFLLALTLYCIDINAAALTSIRSGNWSDSGIGTTPWTALIGSGTGGVPGDGDTVSIGAHTVTVDVNTTVGSSPNDNTTKVVDKTSATGSLIVGAGVTFIVKGSIGSVNSAVITMNAGSTLTFDNSGSGGSPVYRFPINAGFQPFNFNGTLANPCVVQAISGQTFSMAGSWAAVTATYTTFLRCSNLTITSITTGGLSFSDCTCDTCAEFRVSSTSATIGQIYDRFNFINGTGTNDLNLSHTVAYTSGTRRVYRCKLDKIFANSGRGFTIEENYFGGGMTALSTATWLSFKNNLFHSDGTLNGGNGALFPVSSDRNYYIVEQASGNPHFMSATALVGSDNTISNSVFEAQTPDLLDMGDAVIVQATACSGGNKVKLTGNIILPSGYSGAVAASGTMLTIYNADSAVVVECTKNTVCINTHAIVGKRGAFVFSEANNGTAGHLAVLKSNIAWGSSSGQGYLGERVQGNVKDVLTAAGADYNWVFNTSAGDNQRGYEDKASTNTIWTAGDAVAASVDTHQGSGDPLFVDSARNIAKWNGSIGGTATYAAGLIALRADPSLIPSLIDYVFAGFAVRNVTAKTAAHDGGVVGAGVFATSVKSTGGLAQASVKSILSVVTASVQYIDGIPNA